MIALACDHGALDLKKAIMAHLDKRGPVSYTHLHGQPLRDLPDEPPPEDDRPLHKPF